MKLLFSIFIIALTCEEYGDSWGELWNGGDSDVEASPSMETVCQAEERTNRHLVLEETSNESFSGIQY